MNRKNIIVLAVIVGLSASTIFSYTAKAEGVKPVVTSEIAYNKINFEQVNENNAPEKIVYKMDKYKEKKGFVYFEDTDSGYLYIGIMMGEKPTGGYFVNVNLVSDSEGKTGVSVEEKKPAANDIVTQMITYPRTIIRVKGVTSNIMVQNTLGEVYSYFNALDTSKRPIGVACTQGIFSKIETDMGNTYITIEKPNGVVEMFYSCTSNIDKESLRDLKKGDSISINYVLGTPIKYNGLAGFPFNKIVKNQAWFELKNYSGISQNEEWKITFNKDVSLFDINDENIYVKDSKGNNIPVILKLNLDKKSISVMSLQKYTKGEIYYLFISKDIDSEGIKYIEGYRMKFDILK